MGVLFGTDGIRGKANTAELSAELAFRLGRAAAYHLKQETGKREIIVIGKDTRISGDMLESALAAGICSVGMDAVLLGVVPTPAVAFLTRYYRAAAGVVISASHNPAGDNGIKIFDREGYKISDEAETEIENLIFMGTDTLPYPLNGDVGRIEKKKNTILAYEEYLLKRAAPDLRGLKIVVDCANGAAAGITPKLLNLLGAEVIPIFNEPNGTNINENCGSTDMSELCRLVVAEDADIGLAHDGDADRLLAVDEYGRIVDGDHLLVIMALALKAKNELRNNRVVVTVMSNMGLKLAFRAADIEVSETMVGDRFVLEEMVKSGAILGGEQSGHIIFLADNTTGDGILTALRLLEVMAETGLSLSRLAAEMEVLPQVLLNVKVKNKKNWEENKEIAAAIKRAEEELGEGGRVLVRASGTESLIRVMAEGRESGTIEKICREIAETVKNELNREGTQ